ncbi:MAG: hypothetical protein AAF940_10690 [Pseudomonadota bacterium]
MNEPSALDMGCGSGDPIGRYLLGLGCSIFSPFVHNVTTAI